MPQNGQPPRNNESIGQKNYGSIRSSTTRKSTLADYKSLMRNRSFHIVLHLRGILYGTESIWLVFLNKIPIKRFPGYEVDIGAMGAVGYIACGFSNFFVGILLDRTAAFKKITIITTALGFLLGILFTALFNFLNNFISLYFVYVAIAAVYTSYSTTSFHHSVELTYPVSVAKSGVLLQLSGQLYSLVLPAIAGRILVSFGSAVLVYCILALYLVSLLLSLAVADKRPRRTELNSSFIDGSVVFHEIL